MRRAVDSSGLESGRRSLSCPEEVGATPGMCLSVRRVLTVTGQHVVDRSETVMS